MRRADNDPVRLSDGRQVQAGTLRRIFTSPRAFQAVALPTRTRLQQGPLLVRDQVTREAAAAHYRLAAALSGATAAVALVDLNAVPNFTAGNDFRFRRSGIYAVNGHPNGFLLTPGANLTIIGKDFASASNFAQRISNQNVGAPIGLAASQTPPVNRIRRQETPIVPPPTYTRRVLALSNGFSGGSIQLATGAWGDSEIDATVPAGLRGIADLSNVVIEVDTSDGNVYRSQAGRFFAAREEIAVPLPFPPGFIQFTTSGNWPWNGMPQTDNAGGVYRQYAQNDDFDCPAPGQDAFLVTDLPNGFEVSGFTLSVLAPTSTGDGDGTGHDGDHVFFRGYGILGWDQPDPQGQPALWRARVNYGVWRWHRSPTLHIDFGAISSDEFDELLIDAYDLGMSLASPIIGVSMEAFLAANGVPLDYLEQDVLNQLDGVAAIKGSNNGCWSQYLVHFTAIGPAGLTPW